MENSDLVKRYAELELEIGILKNQFAILVNAVADAKTAIMIATNAQTMAAEALIKATTGKSLDEMTGESAGFNFDGAADDPLQDNPRVAFYNKLGNKDRK